MTEKLKPCPACCGTASMRSGAWHVGCDALGCGLEGPDNDRDGAKWNALPRRTDASQGMSDGELSARVALMDIENDSALTGFFSDDERANDFAGCHAWWKRSGADVRAELDRRAAARKESK